VFLNITVAHKTDFCGEIWRWTPEVSIHMRLRGFDLCSNLHWAQ